jgi:Protein of unknown function (DUF3631)
MSGNADLLAAVETFTRRYVVLDEAQATAAALWVPHTWAIEAAHATPYLYVTSAEPECGKTRLLEVLQEIARVPRTTMNISDAALFRVIEAERPTLFLDEVDAVFNPKARERGTKDDLRALLNAGYRRGQVVYRMGGGNRTQLESFAVFGAKALAGLGDLPPTLASRCIRVELTRRRPDEPLADFYPEEVADEAERLRVWLDSWADLHLETLRAARPARVEGLRDRTNEVWRPLLAIAELDGVDGPWAARARRAAVALGTDSPEDASLGLLLLGDVRAVFAAREAERIATADLIGALGGIEESPWGEWWLDRQTDEPTKGAARRLAQLLRPYGIRSKNVRVDETRTPKGYRREDFLDAWERFLPPARVQAPQAPQAPQPAPHQQTDVADVADVAHTRDGGNSRYCPECETPERCAAESSCAAIAPAAAAYRGGQT